MVVATLASTPMRKLISLPRSGARNEAAMDPAR
jgi:hypothetical protein